MSAPFSASRIGSKITTQIAVSTLRRLLGGTGPAGGSPPQPSQRAGGEHCGRIPLTSTEVVK